MKDIGIAEVITTDISASFPLPNQVSALMQSVKGLPASGSVCLLTQTPPLSSGLLSGTHCQARRMFIRYRKDCSVPVAHVLQDRRRSRFCVSKSTDSSGTRLVLKGFRNFLLAAKTIHNFLLRRKRPLGAGIFRLLLNYALLACA